MTKEELAEKIRELLCDVDDAPTWEIKLATNALRNLADVVEREGAR